MRSTPVLVPYLLLALIPMTGACRTPGGIAPAQTEAAKATEAQTEAQTEVNPAAPPSPAAPSTPQPAPESAGAAPATPADTEEGDEENPGIPSTQIEPPDGKWLVDKQGREYFVTPAPRVEGLYRWLNEEKTRVRLPYGMALDVDHYDDEFFYVKIYRPPSYERRPARKPVTEEERQRVAASYQVETAEVDRLRFASFSEGLPARGQWRNGFEVADMNGDGHLDIVHGPPRKGTSRPQIFLGDGAGRWKPWAQAQFPAIRFDYGDVAVADFNGDRKLDLAVASHLRGITALLGDGQGRFTEWSRGLEFGEPGTPGAPSFSSRAIAAFDWNRDGRPDLVALSEGPQLGFTRGPKGEPNSVQSRARGLVVYLNQGDGSWVPRTAEGSGLFGDDLALGDLDGDGRTDILSGSSVQGYKHILNLGREDASWEAVAVSGLRDDGAFRAVTVADFDRDGRSDIALGYTTVELGKWRTGVDVLLARGTSWERKPLAAIDGRTGIYAIAAGDLDGDGWVDLTALDGEGRSLIFLADGKGGFVREASPEVASREVGCRGYHVEIVDLDANGVAEIVAGYAGEPSATAKLIGIETEDCPSGGALQVWKVERGGEKGEKEGVAASPDEAKKGLDRPASGLL